MYVKTGGWLIHKIGKIGKKFLESPPIYLGVQSENDDDIRDSDFQVSKSELDS